MQPSGPALETLTRRLIDIPPDFLDEPCIGDGGQVAVDALVNDLLHMHGARVTGAELARFRSVATAADRNRLALVAIMVWLLADEWFLAQGFPRDALLWILDVTASELAEATPADRFCHDPEHREELARMVLARLDRRPAGETPEQAQDRLSSISGSERRRLLAASRAAERRAQAIREALVRKAAEESADKWTRE